MSEERIPRQIEEADAGAHSMSPQEAFVHSCIDGVLNVDDIADLTVLEPTLVSESIKRLISCGLVEWVGAKVSSAPPTAQLIEDVEIDEALQEMVVQTFKRADRLNHYELLGVAMDADRAEIRKAYFVLSKTFHPDSYYGKRLGSFKAQMEVIFRKVTDAYEVVGRQQKREAYDRYLKRSMVVSAAEEKIHRVEERAQAMSKALTRAPIAERQAGPVDAEAPSQDWQSSQAPAKKSASVVPGTPEHDRMQRKRELLERKLRGRSMGSPKQSVPVRSMPAPTAQVGAKTALRDLTRSLKWTAGLTGGVDRAEHHIEAARTAEAKGDLAAAATALRMAITLDSSRTDVQEQYRRVNSHLRVQLLDIHREQATYEEDNKLWSAASISWAKVAEAAPEDPIAPRRAAWALLSAGGDLRKARDFAQRSLDLAPDSLEARLILARIYIHAGMENSAAKELDAAAKLDPGHEMVKNLRKQLVG
ncbi:MAG: DnaJ domain-containing protein [Myxococcales bacterium]|nr:DnaJ domain-containing protein [Myxococcales bacterium]